MKNVAHISLFLVLMIYSGNSKAQIEIGVFADCQYCDCETVGNRYYRNSLAKLNDCVSEFNKNRDIEFVVGLGDLIDRDFESFSKVKLILEKSNSKVLHVIGNHDFSVEKEQFKDVPTQLNLSDTYYSFNKNEWQFIFLNGNEISLQSNGLETIKQAKKMLEKLKAENKPNFHIWNGGMSETQIAWMEKQLQKAEKEKLKVALFCHYPLLPLEAHTLWNSEKVLAVLEKYNCVKLWMNGHNHAGNYSFTNGIHFVTLKGMVDTEMENAFSIVSFSEDEIKISGFGREETRIIDLNN